MRSRPLLTFPIWPPKQFSPSSTLCFVLMPFTEPTIARVYRDVVTPALEAAALHPNKADDRYGFDVMEDIWTGLNEARLVVADVTGRNPNVFYEVGIAHTLGKPLLLLSADGGKAIPFDLNRFRHILYRPTPRGLQDLRTSLDKVLPEILCDHPTGSRLINELEVAVADWRGPARDFGYLYDPDRLALVRRFTRPQDLSDYAIAFCAASACQWGLPAHMIYWGTLCSQRPEAALDLAFGLFNHQRRPRLRIAHLLAEMPMQTKTHLLVRMAEHKFDRAMRDSIRTRSIDGYVKLRYHALGLTAGERDELLDLFSSVRLSPAPGRPRTAKETR